MRELELRQGARRLLSGAGIRPPLDVRELCRLVGDRRDRPIELRAHPITVPGPSGFRFTRAGRDVIVYQRHTSRPHQEHIVVHELGHLLAGHPSEKADQEVVRPGTLSCSLAPRRACHDSECEQEAELIATVILEWTDVLNTGSGVAGELNRDALRGNAKAASPFWQEAV